MLVDTHAHLDDATFDADRDDVIQRAADAGVCVITVGVNLTSSRAAVTLAAEHESIYAAVGVHPHEAASVTPAVMDELRRLCLHPKVVAVGETGLDWYRNLSPRPVQLDAFAAHLALAAELDLPVLVHNRDADDDIISACRNVQGLRGVMHAFSSDTSMARKVLDTGLHISFAGPLTYKNAEQTREVARMAPVERMLIESDCPYLPPVPWRGQRNEPSYLHLIAESLARLRNISVAQVAEATTRNAHLLFALDA